MPGNLTWYSLQTLVEDYHRVDVREMLRVMRTSRSSMIIRTSRTRFGSILDVTCALDVDAGELCLSHGLGDDWVEEVILLDVTEPNYGGTRFWGLCPGCDARIAVLHAAVLTPVFACRSCHGLSYRTATGTRFERARARVGRLHGKLGGPGLLGFPPGRPRHMKQETYEGLLTELRLAHGALGI